MENDEYGQVSVSQGLCNPAWVWWGEGVHTLYLQYTAPHYPSILHEGLGKTMEKLYKKKQLVLQAR